MLDGLRPTPEDIGLARKGTTACALGGEEAIQRPVKLNNISAARKLLDNMYYQMQADKIADVLKLHALPVPRKAERPRFLFTVKIVIAEGRVLLDSSPSTKLDTFVTLSDENGTRLAKTRTVYEISIHAVSETTIVVR
jgi:hypothetical protein